MAHSRTEAKHEMQTFDSLVPSAGMSEDEVDLLLTHDENYTHPPSKDDHDHGLNFYNALDMPVLVILSMLRPIYQLKLEPGETKHIVCQKSLFDVRVQAWKEGSEDVLFNNPNAFGLNNPLQHPESVVGGVLLGFVTLMAHVHPVVLLIRASLLIKTKHLQIRDDFIVDVFANGRTIHVTGKEHDGKVFALKAKVVDNSKYSEEKESGRRESQSKDKEA